MNIFSETINMTLWQTLVGVATFFLGGFLYEYFKGKGKNRATKEDIGQLTKTIECEGFVEKVILKAKYQYKTTQMKLASAKQEDQIPIKQEYMQQIKQLSASLGDEGGPLFINAFDFRSKMTSRIAQRLKEIEELQN